MTTLQTHIAQALEAHMDSEIGRLRAAQTAQAVVPELKFDETHTAPNGHLHTLTYHAHLFDGTELDSPGHPVFVGWLACDGWNEDGEPVDHREEVTVVSGVEFECYCGAEFVACDLESWFQ